MHRIAVTLLITLAVAGCASIMRGANEIFVIETTPPGATATLSSGPACTTPCSLRVPRRGDFVVTIEREGYETARANIVSNVDGDGAAGLVGNVIFGGFLGAGIDAGSGAMQSHKPNPLLVTLIPMGSTPEEIAALEAHVTSAADGGAEETGEELADTESPD